MSVMLCRIFGVEAEVCHECDTRFSHIHGFLGAIEWLCNSSWVWAHDPFSIMTLETTN